MKAATVTQANEIFSKFCDRLSKVDLKHALLIPAGIGVSIALLGIAQEVHGQSQLIQEHGVNALEMYKASLAPVQDTAEFMGNAMQGKLTSFGGNAQGVGFTVITLGSLMSMVSVMSARGLSNIKSFMQKEGAALKNANLPAPVPAAPATMANKAAFANEDSDDDEEGGTSPGMKG
jgi:hypothetical protein